MDTYGRIMNLTGTEWGGSHSPPHARTVHYAQDGSGKEVPEFTTHSYVIANNNDGFELWFGTNHDWRFHMNSREVRLLTRYLLWEWWVKARWLGFRRPIYYWALRRHLAVWRRDMLAKKEK